MIRKRLFCGATLLLALLQLLLTPLTAAAQQQLQSGMEARTPSTSTPPGLKLRTSLVQGVGADVRARAALYESYIRAAARSYGVDPRVLWTIAYLETRFQPRQVSPKGARGMMQFMPGTAARYNLTNPFDAVAAIDAAARYVRDLSRRFDNRFDLVLASYNAGEGTVEAYLRGISIRLPDGRIINPRGARTGGVPPYAETRNYVLQGLTVANAVTGAGVFSPAEILMSGTSLTLPPGAPAGGAASEPSLHSNIEVAGSQFAFVTPSSSYAFGRTTGGVANEAAVRTASEVGTAATPVQPAARSFRASAAAFALTDESSRRSAAATSLVTSSALPADASTGGAAHPRSTYIAGIAPRR